ncbi:MAG: protease modulator HflC [Bacillota bacterium]
MKKLFLIIILLTVVIIGVNATFFIVDETEQAIVLQFGESVKTVTKPGLNFKIPFIQKVRYFETRVLEYDADPKEVYTADEKNLKIDNYARWKIVEPLLFYQSAGTMKAAQSQLDDIVYSELRAELGEYSLDQIISPERKAIMKNVTENSNLDSESLGIEIIDVRIKRADLPDSNAESVYERMKINRREEANKYRAEGEQQARKVSSQADKEEKVILAEANKKARKLRGKGDAKALEIYAESYNQNPEFYQFTKTLDTYQSTLQDKTTLILGPDSDFLKYFNSIENEVKQTN